MHENPPPLLSIVTITNGDYEPLKRTYESFHPRRSEGIEWIVVSKSATLDVPLLPGDKFISEAKEGIFDAFNKGIVASTGKYLLFMNAGDEFASTEIPNQIMSHLDSGAMWIVGKAYIGKLRKTTWRWPESDSIRFYFGTNSYCHQATVYRRLVFDLYGLFPRKYLSADWAFSLKLSGIVNPMKVDEYWAVFEEGGVSSNRSLLESSIEKCEVRKFYNIAKFPFGLEVAIQFIVNLASWLKRQLSND